MSGVSGTIVTYCLRIIPVILLIGSVSAFFNLINVGPRELPRKHPLNRKMALPVLLEAIGMFMLPIPDVLGTIGVGLCVAAIIWYAVYFRQARLEYPAMTDEDWLKAAKSRYGRMRDFDPKEDLQDTEPDDEE